jgi:hypothetical protein
MIFKNNEQRLANNLEFIYKALRAKRKIDKVIKSCKTTIHLEVASKMIKSYNSLFHDHFGVAELEIQLLSKVKRL